MNYMDKLLEAAGEGRIEWSALAMELIQQAGNRICEDVCDTFDLNDEESEEEEE